MSRTKEEIITQIETLEAIIYPNAGYSFTAQNEANYDKLIALDSELQDRFPKEWQMHHGYSVGISYEEAPEQT